MVNKKPVDKETLDREIELLIGEALENGVSQEEIREVMESQASRGVYEPII